MVGRPALTTGARAQVHDVAEPDELEKLGQAPIRAVHQERTSAPEGKDVKSCQRIHRAEIGWH